MKNVTLSKILNKFGMIGVLLILVVIFSVGSSNFLTVSNGINIIRQISYLMIMVIGMTFVLISGGIDLSVGAQLSFIGVVTALMMENSIPGMLACVLGILLATGVGLVNGVFISSTKVPPMIATLAMQQVIRGIGYILSGGKAIYSLTPEVSAIGQGYVGIIPIPVIIMLIAIVIGIFILNKTYLGRYFYVIGSNEDVARLSGIKHKKIKILSYTFCGLASGTGAIIMMARINSGSPTVGNGFEMDVLTAAVIGGVSASGGEGKIGGAILGTLIMGVLSNGLVILNVNQYMQMVIKGLVLAFAIAYDAIKNSKMQENG